MNLNFIDLKISKNKLSDLIHWLAGICGVATGENNWEQTVLDVGLGSASTKLVASIGNYASISPD